MNSHRKVRVKIYLEPKQNSTLTFLAKVSRKSKSALIRSCIERFIESLGADKDAEVRLRNLSALMKKNSSVALKGRIKKAPSRAEALKLLESIVPDAPPLEEDKMPAAKG